MSNFWTVHSTSGKTTESKSIEVTFLFEGKEIIWLISVDEQVKRKISRGLIMFLGLKIALTFVFIDTFTANRKSFPVQPEAGA